METASTKAEKKEIWKLNGSNIVAFENDSENVQDDFMDSQKQTPQMFYVLDENGKLFHVTGEDGTKF